MLRIAVTTTGTTPGKIAPRMRQATAKAMRGVAFDVRDALVAGMRGSFDRPKPFTLNAFRISIDAGEQPSATVWAMPLQAQYLFWEIEGGERKTKAFEHKLKLFGGQVAIPTQGSRMDGYGNLSRSFIGKILADTNTGGTAKRFFAGEPKGRAGEDGVWARVNNNKRLVRVLQFAEDAEYSERFQMSEIAAETVSARWEYQIMRAIGRTEA